MMKPSAQCVLIRTGSGTPCTGRPQPVSGASFLGKGKLSQRNNKVCYAFNRGVQCRQPRSYAHKCKRCGEPHPVKRCRANNNRSPQLPPARARSEITTPILLTALIPLLAGYDPQLKHYLVHGFKDGFAIGSINVQSTFDLLITNIRSAYQLPHVVDNKLQKELQLGRILGPYDIPPVSHNYRISPLGVVPKKQAGQFRLIHHLSYPCKAFQSMIPFHLSYLQ